MERARGTALRRRARVDHTAAPLPCSIELIDPQVEFIASSADEVASVLAAAEEAARSGLHVVGFVSYDAALPFDPAFRVPGSPDSSQRTPLALFIGFAGAQPAAPLAPSDAASELAWLPDDTATSHAQAVKSIRSSIAEGDAYLVNHTTRLRTSLSETGEAFDLYRRLVTNYGTGWHLYLETDDLAVACGSPELFFTIEDRHITTRPMKGTAARGRWSEEDRGIAARLSGSTKEHAENVMVVDLLRNDLGRICIPGSIAVPSLGVLERHPSLWQLTSTVEGELAAEVGLVETFGALFPSASVTGAPKIAAMNLIADHETSARGLYCGAVGYLPPGGTRAQFAVAIRTAVVEQQTGLAAYGSGGGISWESDPHAEWAEVLTKAASIERRAPGLLGPDEGLIETMGFDPSVGAIANLAAHLARLSASAEYFGFSLPSDLHARLQERLKGLTVPTRVRLAVLADGMTEIIAAPLIAQGDAPQRLAVDLEPICSSEVRLFHKTTDRSRYEDRMARHPEADQVILVNERGEITETNRANLAVKLDGVWWTPALACGLLPGVGRAGFLGEGRIQERIILLEELQQAEDLATISSARGWAGAVLAKES